MSGYNETQGMSNNAVSAYSNDRKPLTQFNLSDYRDYGWTATIKLAKYLAKTNVWKKCEYHHTGGHFYNETNFYHIDDLIEAWDWLDKSEQIKIIKEMQQNKKAEKPGSLKVNGNYVLWGGSKKNPKRIGEQNFTGVKKGDWIHLDDGGKKKANGKYITYQYVS